MDIEKKYELIPSDIEGLFRIKALKDFYDVKKGDIGGYIQSENNLSQLGECWIYDNAKVCDNAVVWGNAKVCYKAKVCDNARVWGEAKIWGSVVIYGNAYVFGNARVEDNAVVWNNAQIYGYAKVCDNAQVCDDAIVRDNARVFANAQIYDNAVVVGNAQICGDAIISSNKDYIIFKNWWSSGRFFTWTRSNNMWKVGCFYGTGEELIVKAYKDSEESGREYEKIVKYVESII